MQPRSRPGGRGRRRSTATAAFALLSLLLTSLALVGTAAAQDVPDAPDAGPVRYLDPYFAGYEVTSDITYGSARNEAGDMQSLELDLYEPAGDPLAERPAIIWIHGGSFAHGSKTGGFEQEQGRELAKRGFVVASIEYRLASTPVNANFNDTESQIAISRAWQDGRAAAEFLRTNAAAYGIDPDVILVSGYSAGGVTAANMALLGNANNDVGTQDDPKHIDGAIAYAGATLSGFAQPGEGPILWFHGTSDNVVPYSMALDAHNAALAVGIDSTMVPKAGATHDLSAYREEFRERTGQWVYDRFVAPAPTVGDLSPRVNPAGTTGSVTITGSGFSGATAVRFGDLDAVSFSVVDDATITATAPVQPAGLAAVTVVGPGGASATGLASLYRYDGAPIIKLLTPSSGPIAGGTTVQVNGAGFLGTTEVLVGSTPAAFTVVNDLVLSVTIPARATPALVNIRATDVHGTSPTGPPSWYRYL